MGFIARRIAFVPVVLFAVAAITYGMPRLLRPELYGGEPFLPGLRRDLEGVFLHFDFGRACGWRGCPEVRDMWASGAATDAWLLGGGLVLGVGGGVLAGIWCARRAGTLAARIVVGASSVVYCTPVYVMGMALLLLFNADFGRWPLPGFFDATPTWASPFRDPWTWLQVLAAPWLLVAAPLAAMCLRLTLHLTREALEEDHIRTAVAKGVAEARIVRRHAVPSSYVVTASFVGVSVPLVVSNMVLVERVLAVPGFFRHTWKASGHSNYGADSVIDYPMLQGLTMWGAVLVVVAGLVVDVVLTRLDPRIRAAGASLG